MNHPWFDRQAWAEAVPVGSSLPAAALAIATMLLAAASAPAATVAGGPSEAPIRHRLAAEQQARGDQRLEARLRAWCDPASGPADAAGAAQVLSDIEQAYRAARAAPRMPADATLRGLVVQRECAASHAARLQPEIRRPVWLISQLAIVRVRPAQGPGHGLNVEAIARNVEGPVVNSHLTFAQGLHMACFGVTDQRGAVRCTLVDTHPHGPSAQGADDDGARGGRLIATLAGRVSPERVELPAVVSLEMSSRQAHPPSHQRR